MLSIRGHSRFPNAGVGLWIITKQYDFVHESTFLLKASPIEFLMTYLFAGKKGRQPIKESNIFFFLFSLVFDDIYI